MILTKRATTSFGKINKGDDLSSERKARLIKSPSLKFFRNCGRLPSTIKNKKNFFKKDLTNYKSYDIIKLQNKGSDLPQRKENIMTAEKLVVLIADEDWNEYSADSFPLGVFDDEENAIKYGLAWLKNQEETETYEEYSSRFDGDPIDYLESCGLCLYTTSYEPTADDLKKAELRKEINELRDKLRTLETALDKLEHS